MGKLRFPLLGLVGLSVWSGLNAVTTEDLYVASYENSRALIFSHAANSAIFHPGR